MAVAQAGEHCHPATLTLPLRAGWSLFCSGCEYGSILFLTLFWNRVLFCSGTELSGRFLTTSRRTSARFSGVCQKIATTCQGEAQRGAGSRTTAQGGGGIKRPPLQRPGVDPTGSTTRREGMTIAQRGDLNKLTGESAQARVREMRGRPRHHDAAKDGGEGLCDTTARV